MQGYGNTSCRNSGCKTMGGTAISAMDAQGVLSAIDRSGIKISGSDWAPGSVPVIETSPSIYYREMYNVLNSLLDQYTYRLAEFLNKEGFPSVSYRGTDTAVLRFSWRSLLHFSHTGMLRSVQVLGHSV